LPYKILGAENDELQMLYAADGSLLQRKYIRNNIVKNKVDYIGDKEFHNDTLEYIHHGDGRVIKNGAAFQYEYNIKDHLGNVRATFCDVNNNGIISNSVVERRSRNDYYSFGMEHYKGSNEYTTQKNNYKYNGKELVEEMGWNNNLYGFRNYDSALGRFSTIDPLESEAYSSNPYQYVNNNPISLIDPFGLKADTTRVYNTGGEYQFTINDKLPNEDHFLSNSKLNDLNNQCCNDDNQEGEYARSISEFYIGTNTRKEIFSILKVSKNENKERGFALYLDSGNRELKVRDLTTDKIERGERFFGMLDALQNNSINNLIGTGHTHLFNFFATSPEVGSMWNDYSSFNLKNKFTGIEGGYPFIIAHKLGLKVYSTATRVIQNYNPNLHPFYHYKYSLRDNYNPPRIKF
jgi:RHS repeat-associated protein